MRSLVGMGSGRDGIYHLEVGEKGVSRVLTFNSKQSTAPCVLLRLAISAMLLAETLDHPALLHSQAQLAPILLLASLLATADVQRAEPPHECELDEVAVNKKKLCTS